MTNTPSGARRSTRRAKSAATRLHDLNNTLTALHLRVSLVLRDSTCRWAQGENLEAIRELIDQARGMAGGLKDERWSPAPAPARR